MKYCIIIDIFVLLLFGLSVFSQANTKGKDVWKTVSDDELITISYNTNIITSKDGYHFVWVKTVYHTQEWQDYFKNMIGSRTPVVTTRTKAEYDEICSYVRVRQVKCYSKAGNFYMIRVMTVQPDGIL